MCCPPHLFHDVNVCSKKNSGYFTSVTIVFDFIVHKGIYELTNNSIAFILHGTYLNGHDICFAFPLTCLLSVALLTLTHVDIEVHETFFTLYNIF